MEAVRPIRDDWRVEREAELPPPPEPFPTQLLTVVSGATHQEQMGYADRTSTAFPDVHLIQQTCVQALRLLSHPSSASSPCPSSPSDRRLAGTLTDLLNESYELEDLYPPEAPSSRNINVSTLDDLRSLMTKVQSNVKECRNGGAGRTCVGTAATSSTDAVREALVLARMDALAGLVAELASLRQAGEFDRTGNRGIADEPPVYESYDSASLPPSYCPDRSLDDLRQSPPAFHHVDAIDAKSKSPEKDRSPYDVDEGYTPTSAAREKMLKELDDVTSAIERLQSLTPRLDAQRSELHAPTLSLAEIEKRTFKDRMREMDEIWRLIERTHGSRRRDAQRMDADEMLNRKMDRRRHFIEGLIENGEYARLDNQDAEMKAIVDVDAARARDGQEREALLERLVGYGETGRLANQEAQGVSDLDSPAKKEAFMERIVEYGSSGRLKDQDSSFSANIVRTSANRTFSTEMMTMRDFFQDPTMLPAAAGEQVNGENGEKKGTMSKLAGVARRKSSGFPLGSPSVDFSSVSYVAEHQENLRTVQVMVHGEGLIAEDDLILEVKAAHPASGTDEAHLTSRRDPDLSLRIELPTLVHPNQVATPQHSGSHLEAKLSALPTTPAGSIASLNTTISHPLSASELRKIRPRAVCCTNCHQVVADVSTAVQSEDRQAGSGFKDLPSKHWAEMLEVWMCHNDPAFTARLARQTNEGFWPTKENVLVGESHLLVHPEAVKLSRVKVNVVNSDDWAAVSCVCGIDLGQLRAADAKHGAGTMRFFKWAIALLRYEGNGGPIDPLRYPLSVFILADLLELAQAHATFRFVMQDETTQEARLLLWLFNPSVSVSYRRPTPPLSAPQRPTVPTAQRNDQSGRRHGHAIDDAASEVAVRTVKAAKVLYKVIDEPLRSDFVSGWGSIHGGQVETASYPSRVVQGLIDTLRESTAIYPPERREMNQLQIGFLERL